MMNSDFIIEIWLKEVWLFWSTHSKIYMYILTYLKSVNIKIVYTFQM